MILDRLGKELIYFDGGTGTLLQERGLKPGELPETWSLERADDMIDIARQYYEAGSDIVLSNTFGANALKFHDSRHELDEIVKAAIENVRKGAKLGVKDGRETYVGLDIGPTGKLLKPMGDLDFEDAYQAFAEVARLGEEAGADLIHIETMSDTYEVKAAVLAAKENTSLPVFATMIFDDKGKLLTGGDVPSVVAMLEGLRVDALGINCGMGPEQMMPILDEILQYASVPVIVKPNAGLPKQKDGEVYYDVEPEEFGRFMAEILKRGASLIGGCCGTTPAHIRAMVEATKDQRDITDRPGKEFKNRTNSIFFSYLSQSFQRSDCSCRLRTDRHTKNINYNIFLIDTIFLCLFDNFACNLYTPFGCCRNSIFIESKTDNHPAIFLNQRKYCIHGTLFSID